MQELPRLSWGCVHKCSLCACLPSESKCASPSAHPCLWLSCGTAHVQVFCLWLHCWLQDHLKEGDGNVIEWFNWTAQWVLKVCQAWGLPLLKKWINSSTGEPQQKKTPSLCKYWQDYVAGNRHWDLEVAKQSAFEIMLCMETMRMSNADMNRGLFHTLWPQDLVQVVWGDPVVLCNCMCAGMADWWRDQFVLKYMTCSLNQ